MSLDFLKRNYKREENEDFLNVFFEIESTPYQHARTEKHVLRAASKDIVPSYRSKEIKNVLKAASESTSPSYRPKETKHVLAKVSK